MKKLLVTVDSLRYDCFDLMENTIDFLDFTHNKTFSVSTATMGSFPATITGHYPHQGSLTGSPFASYLDVNCIAITSNHLLSGRYGYDDGFDVFEAPGSDNSTVKDTIGRQLTPGSTPYRIASTGWNIYQTLKGKFTPTSRSFRPASDIISAFQGHVEGRDEWAGWLHFMEPHHPYEPNHLKGHSRVECQNATRRVLSGTGTEDDKELVWIAYKQEVIELDRELQKLWEWVDEDVEIIFCSDHGELFGEDGRWGHPGEMRSELLHVPFASKNIDDGNGIRSLVDVPTLLCEEKIGHGDLDRECAYATYGDKKAVVDKARIYDGSTYDVYDELMVEDKPDDDLQQLWQEFEPDRIVKEDALLEDLKELGYV